MRPFRYLWRIPLLLLHMLLAIPAALLAQGGWAQRRRWRGERLDLYAVRWWAGRMLRIMGVRVQAHGQCVPGPVMLVVNHSSWLDIVLVHSQRAACFVAKAEIERWPMVGWMAAHAGTIFHRRGNNESMQRVQARMRERLTAGRAVAVFPEGSTGPVGVVRTFHARVLQAAVDADVPVQPVALRFSRQGAWVEDVAFLRGESFFANALRLLGGPPLQADVHFLDPVDNRAEGRRAMAAQARARVAAALGVTLDAA